MLNWQQWVTVGMTLACMMVGIPTQAEVVTDGTLGAVQNLTGPDYQIGPDLGQQHGGNLFHSFQDFNLQRLESATFSGPDSIQNVISRVTGGNPSKIDGLIRSTIPNADMYFLNPYGIMFGPNARLDVQGSFHASTADYLRLGNGGIFHARNPNDSVLTVAPIESFGFLTDSPGAISVKGSELIVSAEKVEPDKLDSDKIFTLSLIGGDLSLEGDSSPAYEQNELGIAIFTLMSSRISAKSGRLNLASIASEGEIIPTETGLNFSAGTKPGTITTKNIQMTVSGENGGTIYIRSGKFVLENSLVDANTLGEDGYGREINIKANQFFLNKGWLIADHYGMGKGSDINIDVNGGLFEIAGVGDESSPTDDFFYTLETPIFTRSWKTGPGGNITINARQLHLKEGRHISTHAFYEGDGGHINITTTEDIILSGDNQGISVIGAQTEEVGGNAGNITLKARDITLKDGAQISTASIGSGKAGEINLEARQLSLVGKGAQINSNTYGTGQGGNIYANITQHIIISGEGFGETLSRRNGFSSSTDPYSNPLLNPEEPFFDFDKAGSAGEIVLTANELIMRDGVGKISASTYGKGQGGKIVLNVNHIQLANESFLLANSSLPFDGYEGALGDAGNIVLNVTESLRMVGSSITTEAERSGGGQIFLTSPGYLYLTDSHISSDVKTGQGDGGNITLNAKLFVLEDNSTIENPTEPTIKATAHEGNGGNIIITTAGIYGINKDGNYKNPHFFLDAKSKFGTDGIVTINSPEEDNLRLDVLSPSFSRPEDILRDRCAGLTRDDLSSFTIIIRDVFPESPLNLKTHYLFDLD